MAPSKVLDATKVKQLPLWYYRCKVDRIINGNTVALSIDPGFELQPVERTLLLLALLDNGILNQHRLQEWVDHVALKNTADNYPFIVHIERLLNLWTCALFDAQTGQCINILMGTRP